MTGTLPHTLQKATRPLFKRCVAWILENETGVDSQTFVDHMQVVGMWPDYKITVSHEMFRVLETHGICLFDPCWDATYIEALRKNFS